MRTGIWRVGSALDLLIKPPYSRFSWGARGERGVGLANEVPKVRASTDNVKKCILIGSRASCYRELAKQEGDSVYICSKTRHNYGRVFVSKEQNFDHGLHIFLVRIDQLERCIWLQHKLWRDAFQYDWPCSQTPCDFRRNISTWISPVWLHIWYEADEAEEKQSLEFSRYNERTIQWTNKGRRTRMNPTKTAVHFTCEKCFCTASSVCLVAWLASTTTDAS